MYFDNASCCLCYATPRMFLITTAIVLENFQPPNSRFKQIVCNHSTGKKTQTTIQDVKSGELGWFSPFNFYFPSELGQVASSPCTSLFPAVKWGEYYYLPTSQGCCEDQFRFMECFHAYCWKALCKYKVLYYKPLLKCVEDVEQGWQNSWQKCNYLLKSCIFFSIV